MASWDDSPVKKKKRKQKLNSSGSHPPRKCLIHIAGESTEDVSPFTNTSWKVKANFSSYSVYGIIYILYFYIYYILLACTTSFRQEKYDIRVVILKGFRNGCT